MKPFIEFVNEELLDENWAKRLADKNKAIAKAERDARKLRDEAKKLEARQAKEDKLKSDKEMSGKIAWVVSTTVGDYIPDSDGYEAVAAKVAKMMGVSRYDDAVNTAINSACKKHLGSKDFYAYVEDLMKELKDDGHPNFQD